MSNDRNKGFKTFFIYYNMFILISLRDAQLRLSNSPLTDSVNIGDNKCYTAIYFVLVLYVSDVNDF